MKRRAGLRSTATLHLDASSSGHDKSDRPTVVRAGGVQLSKVTVHIKWLLASSYSSNSTSGCQLIRTR